MYMTWLSVVYVLSRLARILNFVATEHNCFVQVVGMRDADKTPYTIINRESFLKRENWRGGIVRSLLSVRAASERARAATGA